MYHIPQTFFKKKKKTIVHTHYTKFPLPRDHIENAALASKLNFT